MSFLWNWISNLLQYLGLGNRAAKVLFLGLENAGKTSLLGMLKDGKIQTHSPTWHAHFEELKMGKLTFTAFDLGGHDQARRVWNQYFPAVDSVVFVVDAADRKVMSKVVYELDKLLNNEQISHCPILVLGNKKDRLDAMGEDELRYSLGLHGRTTGKGKVPRETLMTRPIELFMASVVRGEGYGEGFRWLAQYL